MLVNHANLGLLFTGFKATFQSAWELAEPIWPTVAMEIPSQTEAEEYDWLGLAEGMREWVDDRVITGLRTHGFQIRNKDWEQTVGVERNKIEDDKYGIYSPIVQRMGMSARLHPDELIFGDLINNGRNADHLGYDGVPFFNDSHPDLEGGLGTSQSNIHSNGSGPYWYLADFSTPLKPFIYQNRRAMNFVAKTSMTDDNVFFQKKFLMGVDARYNVGYGMWQQVFASNRELDATNLEAAWEAMENIMGYNGKPMRFSPTHLIVPTSLRFAATRLVSPQLVPVDQAGVTNIHQGSLQIIISKHLDRT